MQYLISLIMIVMLLGCGDDTAQQETLTESSISNTEKNTTTPIAIIETETETITIDTNETEKLERTVTVYVHGYSPSGASRVAIFGENDYLDEEVTEKIVEFTGYSTAENFDKENDTNILAIASYYGNVAPSYYSPEDRRDIFNGKEGIPRYAHIIAKFAREMMSSYEADKVQFISASMGSLVTRYLIEKDLENLSSNKKITQWLSLEGVIAGNVAASSDSLYGIVNSVEEQSIDVDHMNYSWINDNLGSLRTATSAFYQDIKLGFQSSTDDSDNSGALTYWLRLNDNFEANDGYQIVNDTYFSTYLEETGYQDLYPTHTFFHETHTSLSNNRAAWAYAATFLTSNKRVKITLLDAEIQDLHEDDLVFNINIKPAEIVFESTVFSPATTTRWGIENAIDTRSMRGGNLPLHHYNNENVTKVLNQTLFDSYVLEEETTLTLNLTPIELDMEPNYDVREFTGHGDSESLDTKTIQIPLQNASYTLQANQWSGEIKVEIY